MICYESKDIAAVNFFFFFANLFENALNARYILLLYHHAESNVV